MNGPKQGLALFSGLTRFRLDSVNGDLRLDCHVDGELVQTLLDVSYRPTRLAVEPGDHEVKLRVVGASAPAEQVLPVVVLPGRYTLVQCIPSAGRWISKERPAFDVRTGLEATKRPVLDRLLSLPSFE